MAISLTATIITVALAVPLGILLTRGRMRRFARPITIVAGFGQAAPAIGLIALGAVLIALGFWGAVVALVVYGALPIIANTVAGINSVDPKPRRGVARHGDDRHARRCCASSCHSP